MEELNIFATAKYPASGEQLRDIIFNLREVEPDLHIYAMLDLNHPVPDYHDLHPAWLDKRETGLSRKTFLRPDFILHPDICPQIIRLVPSDSHGCPDEELIDLSVECAVARCRSINEAYVAAWFATSAKMNDVLKHFSSKGTVLLPNGTREYLPYFEPHRMALLLDAPAAHKTVREWLGPIHHWMYVDINGALQVVHLQTPATSLLEHHQLPQQAMSPQIRIKLARAVLMALDKVAATLGDHPERELDQAVQAARASGLTRSEDLIFHAVNTCTLGPQWAEYPLVKNLIREAITEEGKNLPDLMAALPDETLDAIAAGAQQNREHGIAY